MLVKTRANENISNTKEALVNTVIFIVPRMVVHSRLGSSVAMLPFLQWHTVAHPNFPAAAAAAQFFYVKK